VNSVSRIHTLTLPPVKCLQRTADESENNYTWTTSALNHLRQVKLWIALTLFLINVNS